MITEYSYDPLHRLLAQASYGPTGRTTPTDSSNHVYDALDRPLEENEDHQGTTNDRKTVFSHLGLNNMVTEEKQTGGGDPQGLTSTTSSRSTPTGTAVSGWTPAPRPAATTAPPTRKPPVWTWAPAGTT